MELDDTLRMGFRLGEWVVRPIEGIVISATESRHLQPKTMDVLVCLAASDGQVLTRDELIERVWGANAVSDEPLTRCIHELRRALNDHRGKPTYIQTIPKRGYQLLIEVRDLQATDLLLAHPGKQHDNPIRQVTRQRVLWVGLVYAALAWTFVQLAGIAERSAGAALAPPEWLLPAFIMIILLGFPVAIFFAWVQQLKFDEVLPIGLNRDGLRGALTLLWSRRGLDTVLVTLVISGLAGFALDVAPFSTADAFEQQPTVAVLPFAGADGLGERNWLGNGVAENVQAALAVQPELAVRSVSVSFRASLRGMEPRQIGQELAAQYLLRGLVIRGDGQIRVKAWLYDTVTGIEVWSGSWREDSAAVLAVERELVAGVLEYLQVPVPPWSDQPARVNFAAYDNYLRGRDRMRTAASVTEAEDAAYWYSAAIDVDDRIPMARSGLCQAYVLQLELGRPDGVYGKANSACAEAILQSPESVAAHLALAGFYRVSGHSQDAIAAYNWVVEREPANASGWFGLARAHADTQSLADADDAFRRVLSIRPDCADAHQALVAFLLDNARYVEARDAARELVRLDSDRADSYSYLATALLMTGDFEAAIKASREVLRRDIENRAAVLNIARSYYHLGSYENAINIYGQMAKLEPTDYEAQAGLAKAFAMLDQEEARQLSLASFRRARQLVERHLQLNSQNFAALAELAYYCAALDDLPCAREQLARALLAAPDNVDVQYAAALVHARSGDIRQAGLAAQRALALGYPEALIDSDPLLAATVSDRRFASGRVTALFLPASLSY